MKLRFPCPECQYRVSTDQVAAGSWNCPGCGVSVPNPSGGGDAPELARCRHCGNEELYVQKAFPNWLGMTVVVLAGVGFLVFHWFYFFYAAWACLLGAAAVDTLLYFLMGNMTVCYRCAAQHLGFPKNPAHLSFDLGTAEKYRQEKIRRQELGGAGRAKS
jgi:hypothetical protein